MSRNLHVVSAGSTPVAEGGGPAPQTFMFDVHNASGRAANYELLLNASIKPFDLSLVVNRGGILGNEGVKILDTSLEAVGSDALDIDSRHHWEAWREALERLLDANRERAARWAELNRDSDSWSMYKLAKLSALDFGRFLTTNGQQETSLSVSIPRGQFMTIVATWRPPVDAKPGWNAELEVVQRRGKPIVGGSTYALRVVEPSTD